MNRISLIKNIYFPEFDTNNINQKLIDALVEAITRMITLIKKLDKLEMLDEEIDLASLDQHLIEPNNIVAAWGIAQADAPIIGSGISTTAPTMGPLLSTLLTNLGANVRTVNLDSSWANKTKLETEVHLGIEAIRRGDVPLERSIPETLLKHAPSNSEIGKIRDTAKMTMITLEAIALPGGGDIEPEFYSNAPCRENHDYRRTITEFALVFAADEMQKSVSATCRGQQLLNVCFGGTVETVHEHQYGWHKIELSESPYKDTLTETLQDTSSFHAYSNHSQACAQIASNFHVVASYDSIPKCIMNQSGSFMGFQFHPELSEDGRYSPSIRFYEPWFKGILDRRSSNITSFAQPM